MSDLKPGRGSDQFPLRLPDGMRDRIKEAAMDNSRSMNAEIVARLEESFVVPHLRELIDEQDKLGETREKLLELHKD